MNQLEKQKITGLVSHENQKKIAKLTNKLLDRRRKYCLTKLNKELATIEEEQIDLAEKKFNAGNSKGAIKILRSMLENNSDQAEAFCLLGLVYHVEGNLELSISSYNRAIQLIPDDYCALNMRGLVYLDHGNYQAAIMDFDKSIELGFTTPENFHYRGEAKFENEDFDGAITDFETSIVYGSDIMPRYYYLAMCYFQINKIKKGLEFVDLGLNVYPNDKELKKLKKKYK